MIIKSMSRKSATFDQLIDYINSGKSDERFNVFHNVYSRNFEQLKKEFKQNSERLAKRKNGVFLYHEILSITRAKGISEKRQKEIFCQLAQQYAQGRAGNNMVYAGMHDDKEHNLHYHFVISANGVNDSKRLRLSKHEFSKFKIDFEKMVLQQYPELEQGVIIQRTSVTKLSKKGGELKRRTGKVPLREKVINTLKTAFEQSFSHDDFIRHIDQAGFNFYIRGKNPGVEEKETGRKYRLRTLGLLDQLETLDDTVQQTKKKPQSTQTAKPKKSPAGEKEKTAKNDQTSSKPTQTPQDDIKSKKRESGDTLDEKEQIAKQRAKDIKKQRQSQSKNQDNDKHKR